jgi:hypothetical protein
MRHDNRLQLKAARSLIYCFPGKFVAVAVGRQGDEGLSL